MRWGTTRRWIVRAVLTLLSVAAVGELIARYHLGLGDPPLSVEDEAVEYRFRPGVYHRFGNTISINLFSMRSGPIAPERTDPRELRILVVGDSVVNGGSLTDDRDLATAILQRRLADALGRPVYVANISAGSWGPPNQAAYLRKFGWFDADAFVLVLSSHDGADTPAFEPTVGVHPGYPSERPPLALVEMLSRYSPLSGLMSQAPVASFEQQYPSPSDEVLEVRKARCSRAITEMLAEAEKRQLPRIVVMHSTRPELAGEVQPERDAILQALARSSVSPISAAEAFKVAMEAGENPYRENDDIHPSASGQRILADLLYEQLLPAMSGRLAMRLTASP